MLYATVNKVLNWGIKVASLAVTGPATWIVASDLFSDIHDPRMLFLMQVSAVFLIEGVMLSNWLLLEFDKKATSKIKARYGLTALTMYIALLVIGWRHEGPTGLVFRIALLAALLGSGWDTYVYTWQRATEKADRDISVSASVKRHWRKLSILDAKEALVAEYELTRAQRQVDKLVRLQEIEANKLERLTALEQEHQSTLSNLTNSTASSRNVKKIQTKQRSATRRQALDKMLDIYRANPGASLREVGVRIGRSHQTVSDYLDRLEEQGRVYRNGKGIEVID